jgi:tetratricopeptide (TPR) repeat protein
MMRKINLTCIAIFISIFLFGCTKSENNNEMASKPIRHAILVEGTGTYSRKITTDSGLAQKFFDQGLRYAWAFHFPESIASYQQAAVHDPSHPMIYWGMAHAIGPNPNSRYSRMPDDPKGEGLKAINKAMSLIENANPMEKEMILALHILYDKESISDDNLRDEAYMEAADVLQQKYPTDPDIVSLYAESYMNIGRWDYWEKDGTPKSATSKVANALESVLESSPNHTGANHLHIHLLEASQEPERALGSADRLEATMPIVGHVVHMPAHIYVRVGQYNKAIDSNMRSVKADSEFLQIWGDLPFPDIGTYPLSAKIHPPHAIDFIKYAATVQGNYKVAINAAKKMEALMDPSNVGAVRAQTGIAGPWLVNKIFGKWDELLDTKPAVTGTPYLDGIWSYSIGSTYVAKGLLSKAKQELDNIKSILSLEDVDQYRVGANPVSVVLKLAELALIGEIHEAEGDLESAIEAYSAAVVIEDQNNYTEPPSWLQPMRHYLGAALIDANDPIKAEVVFRRDLSWHKNNGWSLFGLWKSLEMQGKSEEAEQIFNDYEQSWVDSDVILTRSRF